MAFTKFEKDMAIISALDDEPNDVGGLTAAELKAKFDEGGQAIKKFLNETMTAEMDAFDENNQEALGKKVDKTTKVNGHPLDENITITKSDVGLGNVDNTADADKPISTAQQEALAQKADKTELQGVVLGQIPDGTITGDKIAPGTITENLLSPSLSGALLTAQIQVTYNGGGN